MTRRLITSLMLLGTAVTAHAQDVEVRARAGVRLPDEYYARIAAQPDLFDIDRGWTARSRLVSGTNAVVTGTLPLVVVQALFADSPEPAISSSDIQRILFDGPTPHGTVTQFYREISGGRFTVTGSVLPWVRTAITRAEAVGSSYGLGGDAEVGTFLMQALERADAHVDFTRFDNDGADGVPNSGDDDGYVDAVAFQFIERAASCGGDGIWPHRSRLRSMAARAFASADTGRSGAPILVDSYIVQSTVDCAGAPMTASVIAHELGHVLGLPDLYHAANGILPSQRRWVLGCWTLMAAGAWGCGDGSTYGVTLRPVHMGPWEKATLGWIDEQIVGSVREHDYVLEPVQTSGRSLRVPLDTVGHEYLQIEYRPRLGFDVDLPAAGVLIYHIDLTRPLYPRATDPRVYRVALKEADGDSALRRTALEGGNRGVAGDAWALGGAAAFSNMTNPPLRRNSGLPSTVTIHSIAIRDGAAHVRLSTAAAPALVGMTQLRGTALAQFTGNVRAAGGALPYQWTVAGMLPPGVLVTPDAERLVFSGTPRASGTFQVDVSIADALGTVAAQSLTLVLAAVTIETDRLLQSFLRSQAAPLSTAEQDYLDNSGNRNGRYDVGDLRRYLLQ